MKRIATISHDIARLANCATRVANAVVVVTLTLVLASCVSTEEIDAAYLTLTTANVKGFITNAATRANAADVAVTTFKNGDVIKIDYDFDDDYSTPKNGGTVYARLNAGVWTIYSNLNLTTVVKLRPNPANLNESLENLRLRLVYHPLGIVTDSDGKKRYETNSSTNADGVYTCYDQLLAYIPATTSDGLAAEHYHVNKDWQISACFAHQKTLLSLSEADIKVSGYPEGYDRIIALTGSHEHLIAPQIIGFTLKPGAEAGKGTWQAITFATVNGLSNFLPPLISLTATLAKGNTPGITVAVPITNFMSLYEGIRYPLKLTLSPTHSIAAFSSEKE